MRDRSSAETTDENLVATLSSLEEATNYRDWLLRLARPFLAAPVLEIGAGRGTFTPWLAAYGAVTAVEPSDRMAELLAASVVEHAMVTVVVGELDAVPALPDHGSAVMFNVLEHIPDDGDALRQIYDRLRPGGHLVVWVPAFRLLFSDFDRKIGHHRRYRVRGLKRLVKQSGFSLVRARYANFPGWFSWLLFCRLLRANPAGGALPRVFDRFFVPVISRVERVIRPPFGQSIFLVARKPD